MENMSIGQYRSHDPAKNFALRVKFSKVTPESVIPTARFPIGTPANPEVAQDTVELAAKQNDDEENEELVIHWQEKLFSQREFDHYGDRMNCINSLDLKYHEDVETIKRTLGERPNKRVFTYVDCDSFAIHEELSSVTLSENDPASTLAEKMSIEKYSNMTKKPFNTDAGLRRRKLVIDEPTEAMKSNHVITTPRKRMRVMVDLTPKNNDAGQLVDERILCTIKIDANGLIVMKPDIVQKETFKIEVYHETRMLYEYSLEDASVMITKLQKSQEGSLYKELYNRHAQLMQLHVGNELTPLPQSNEIFVQTLCEIISTKGFEYDSQYVQYFLELPPGWKSPSKILFGVTQSCSMNTEGVAHFSFPIDFQLQYQWPEDNPDEFLQWPILYLQVYSLDSWQRHRIEGYGYCQLPDVAGTTCVQVDTWRPKNDGAFSDMRRYFIGGTRELKDDTYVKKPAGNEDSKLSKFYFKTVSAGSIILRMNTILQTKVIESPISGITRWKKVAKKVGEYTAAVDSLTQVMDAFHRARKKMLSARSTLPVIT